ncbi:hypothetical protein EV385_5230 [Krasilnikovia cinnamomea]|uniref:Uncharacterized protein n=1 Tax=Krasilnikovia cinnamomea TaxID=349313 RepID=A0A4Q7ZQC2_9ACTN|nr:hypothetical protein [Krasilnikovia cinnamomea]RZU53312.1 hypothetical protein EV385_5230 [Krasilnikovia cinnamomea]
MLRLVEVNRSFRSWKPELYPEPAQDLDHPAGLATGERPLELADHHCIEPTIRLRGRGQQGGRLRTFHPRQLRDAPGSKNSIAIRPLPAISRCAASSCHARDDTGS